MLDTNQHPAFVTQPCALHDAPPHEAFTRRGRDQYICCNGLVKKEACDLLRKQQTTNNKARFYAQRASIRLALCRIRLTNHSR